MPPLHGLRFRLAARNQLHAPSHREDEIYTTVFYYTSRGANTTPDTSSITKQEGNALFNDVLNTFYLRLYGVGHMVKDH